MRANEKQIPFENESWRFPLQQWKEIFFFLAISHSFFVVQPGGGGGGENFFFLRSSFFAIPNVGNEEEEEEARGERASRAFLKTPHHYALRLLPLFSPSKKKQPTLLRPSTVHRTQCTHCLPTVVPQTSEVSSPLLDPLFFSRPFPKDLFRGMGFAGTHKGVLPLRHLNKVLLNPSSAVHSTSIASSSSSFSSSSSSSVSSN